MAKPTEGSERAALELRSVGCRVADTLLLENVSFRLTAGARVAVVGPSGAGKSTLFDVIAGERSCDRGQILLSGQDVTRMPLWRRARAGLSYVPQGSSVLLDLTVAENIAEFQRMPTCRHRQQRPAELAARFELDAVLNTSARELSGGERRRLELLRGVMGEPSVLLLDEPFAGLDPRRAAALTATLRRALEDSTTTLLIADHRLTEALALAEEAFLLLDGRLELRCSARQFLEHPAVRARYLAE